MCMMYSATLEDAVIGQPRQRHWHSRTQRGEVHTYLAKRAPHAHVSNVEPPARTRRAHHPDQPPDATPDGASRAPIYASRQASARKTKTAAATARYGREASEIDSRR
jgi:hypothetical protein